MKYVATLKDLGDDIQYLDGVRKAVQFSINIIKDSRKVGLSEEQIEELDIHVGNVMQTKQGLLKLVDF